jgi:AraC-like DNA-binding protein
MTDPMLKTPSEPERDPCDVLRQEIDAVVARYSEASDGYETPVSGLHVARITRPIPPTTLLTEACVCICVRGSRELTICDAVYVHDENRYLLSAVGLPTIVTIDTASPDNPYTALRIDLDLDLARQVMAEIGVEREHIAQPASRLSFGVIDRDFLDAVTRLVRLIEAPKDASFMSSLIRREILYRLLSGPSGLRLRQIVGLGSQGHRVAKAVTWLRSHFRERLKIDKLAAVAGLDESADVGSAALNVGYESSTQFIREYRRLFGVPPLRDVKAVRARGGYFQII